MTLIVNQLESYDKSNLDVIRIEFAKLQKKLEECQKDQEFIKPEIGRSTSQNILDNNLKIRDFQPTFNILVSFQATAIIQES